MFKTTANRESNRGERLGSRGIHLALAQIYSLKGFVGGKLLRGDINYRNDSW